MTGRPTENGTHIGLAPPDEPARAEYQTDIYSWSQEQARLLREGHWTLVDRDNVAEEIESVGATEFNRLESALRVLLLHVLEWEHQPQKRSRSWALSIKEQRLAIDDVLADNPGLKPRIGEALARAYRRARIEAAKETGLDEAKFPETCSYSFEDATTRKFKI
jgi:hypothetical protein